MAAKRCCYIAVLLACGYRSLSADSVSWPPDWSTVDCADVQDYSSNRSCKFVQTANNCQPGGGLIPYLEIIYCDIGTDLIPLGVTILVIWLFMLFLALAATAEDYFCPSLTVISKSLRLNQNVAGVTFLAFGNGAPDIFSAIAAITAAKQGDISLAIGALFGAGMFVSLIVVGAICITTSFTLTSRPFLRDVIFYILAVTWTFAIIWNGKIYLGETVGFIALYTVYVAIVVLGHYIYQKRKKQRAATEERQSPDEDSHLLGQNSETSYNKKRTYTELEPLTILETNSETSGTFRSRDSMKGDFESPADMDAELLRTLQQQRRQLRIKRSSFALASALDIGETIGVAVLGRRDIAHRRRASHLSLEQHNNTADENAEDTESLTSSSSSIKKKTQDHPIIYALKGLKPFDYQTWKEEGIVWKIPIIFLLQLTVPVVDYEEDHNNWNKWLNVWHCVAAPVFITFAAGGNGINLNGVVPVWAVVLAVSTVVALTVIFTSRSYDPPVYHVLFAYLGFAVSMVWIYLVANEIVDGIQTTGIVFNIKTGILGLTFLAWANSIGDFISDLTMAKQGFPRMGVSACFGGPLLNLLLGFGIGTTIICLQSEDYTVELSVLSSVEFICAMFLLANLAFSLFIITIILRFNVGRIYGITLICIYIIFLIVAILGERRIVPSPL